MYSAIFFDGANEKVISLMSENPLDLVTEKPNIPVSNGVDHKMRELFGTPIIVEITGYGHDERNEGLSCRIQSIKPEMQEILDKVHIPFITLSVRNGEKSSNTRYLEFEEFNLPYTCKGYYGGYDEIDKKFYFGKEKING